MKDANLFRFPPALAAALDDCWRRAAAPAEWNLTRKQFLAVLERSAAHRFCGSSPDAKAIGHYLESLHLADLALACACSEGSEVAWDAFVAQYRPELYRAARAIVGESNARELADSLYAELYGLHGSDGKRKSLFTYFHGRSKLGTWLRAVLAQRHVDELRRTRRTDSLDELVDNNEQAQPVAMGTAVDPEREKYLAVMQAVLSMVLDGLGAHERLRLAYYYVEKLTLAEIGRLLGEHEATVSRRLDRARREIRCRVDECLRGERKLSEAQLRLCYEYARGEWPFDLTVRLRSGQAVVPPEADDSLFRAR
jgi:RNA polymerase sigma-70 factor (ECF subfamily)